MKSRRTKAAQERFLQIRAAAEQKAGRLLPSPDDLVEQTKEQLIHELRVCRIELDMQNEELLRSKVGAALYHDLVETSQDLIWQCDTDGRFVYLNPAWVTTFGYGIDEMLGRKFSEFQRVDIAERDDKEFSRLIRGGLVKGFETVYVGKTGEDIHLVLNGKRALDEDGNLVGMRGTAYDITGRKRNEDSLRQGEALLNEVGRIAKVGGWVLQVATRQLTWTEEMYRIHAVDPAFKPTFEKAIGFYAPASREILIQAFQRASEQGEPFELELEMVTAAGNPRWVHVIGRADTARGRVSGTFQDITENKKTGEELEAYRRHLELQVDHRTAELGRVNKSLNVEKRALQKANADLKHMQTQFLQTEKMASLGRLASGIAHEINNPIGYISTNLAVLKHYADIIDDMFRLYADLEASVRGLSAAGTSEPLGLVEEYKREADVESMFVDFRKLIEESSRGAALVAKIVTDLRSFAREEKVIQETADIHQIIDATLNISWSQLKYSVEVIKKYGELPPVLCYPRQMEQVFVNLFLNAAHAVGVKGRIIISTCWQDDKVIIEVEDNGCGIRERDLSRIFEPFFTTMEVGEGSGMGLAVVYNIIEKHEGKITVRSQLEQGTVVTIKLPVGGKSQ